MSRWLAIGGISAGIGVALGAFAAHGLKGRVAPDLLAVFETGVRYQMYHSLALVAVGALAARAPGAWLERAGWAFLLGIAIFSGSLYLLVLTDARWLGAVTPLGGLAFLAGWAAFVAAVWRRS
jgi:uncharacterized membrane protein YgdD (TMEM256/DUF423 family)